jgi:molybdate transport system ATP-binding protein
VRALLPLPDRVRVTVEAGATLTAEVTREAAATLALAPGRPVWASVKATSIRVYA